MRRLNDDESSRRSSFTHFFSPAHHHEHVLRKRAQSLHAQSTRDHSILQHHDDIATSRIDAVPGGDSRTNTPDRKSILKLSISAPLPTSAFPNRPHISDISSSSYSPSHQRTSFIEIRHHDEPPSSSERKVQFIEPESPHHHNHHNHTRTEPDNFNPVVGEESSVPTCTTTRAARRNSTTPIKKRTVARVSITTGKLYYIQEPIPEYPFPSTTWFSPPPSPSRSHAHHHHSHVFNFNFRRSSCYHHGGRHDGSASWAGVCPHLRSGFHHLHHDGGSTRRVSGEGRTRQNSRTSSNSTVDGSVDYDHAPPGSDADDQDGDDHSSPLYTSASEKLYAHWGTLTLNMRFSMFRAQNKMKDGVAWMGGVVRKMRTGRQY